MDSKEYLEKSEKSEFKTDKDNLRAKTFELNCPLSPKYPEIDIKKFRNINKVKAENDVQFISPEQAAFYAKELKRCKDDPVYFAENYFEIISYKGQQKIKLFSKQKEMLKSMIDNKYSIFLSARQSGKCVYKDTKIKCRNKETGEIWEDTIENLFLNS